MERKGQIDVKPEDCGVWVVRPANIWEIMEMSSKLLPQWSTIAKPVIGMLHLPPLPGSPRFSGNVPALRDRVFRDAQALVGGGVHALMMENFGDVPFYPGSVPNGVVA